MEDVGNSLGVIGDILVDEVLPAIGDLLREVHLCAQVRPLVLLRGTLKGFYWRTTMHTSCAAA